MAKVFCLDQHNNYVETMSKEDIIAAIQTAANGGSLEGFSNTAVISKIKEINKSGEFSIWVGTSAEYNKLDTKKSNVLYILSDDPLAADMPNRIQVLSEVLQGQGVTILQHENGISNLNDAVRKNAEALEAYSEALADQSKTIEVYSEALANQSETLEAHGEQLQRVANVGYTTLYNELNENYTDVGGIAISENYDNFDFLIFEFEEVTNSSLKWRARAMLSTFELIGFTNHGIYLTFLATECRTTVRLDASNKKRIYFYESHGTDVKLAAIYGYNRKGVE